MLCDRCNTFRGDPCPSCRTASRITWILQTRRLHPSFEDQVLNILRNCSGGLTDLVELSSRVSGGTPGVRAGVEDSGRAKSTPRAKEESEGGSEEKVDKSPVKSVKKEKKVKAKKERKEKSRSRSRGRRQSHSSKITKEELRIKEEQESCEEDEPAEVKEEEEEEAGEGSRRERARRDRTREPAEERLSGAHLTEAVNRYVDTRPEEFGLSHWPSAGAAAPEETREEEERPPLRRPREPSHPPPNRWTGGRGPRQHGEVLRPKKNKGKKHRERGVERQRRGLRYGW